MVDSMNDTTIIITDMEVILHALKFSVIIIVVWAFILCLLWAISILLQRRMERKEGFKKIMSPPKRGKE